jgi:hypothetical protein
MKWQRSMSENDFTELSQGFSKNPVEGCLTSKYLCLRLDRPELDSLMARMSGAPQSSGRAYLEHYWIGGRLTARQSILAKCAVCCGYYVEGRKDCGVPTCPLYPWMPYRAGRVRYTRPKKVA